MNILIAERGAGKSSSLVRISAETGAVIITDSLMSVNQYKELAKEMELTIPNPQVYITNGIASWRNELVLIDDIEVFLKAVFGLNVVAATSSDVMPYHNRIAFERQTVDKLKDEYHYMVRETDDYGLLTYRVENGHGIMTAHADSDIQLININSDDWSYTSTRSTSSEPSVFEREYYGRWMV